MNNWEMMPSVSFLTDAGSSLALILCSVTLIIYWATQDELVLPELIILILAALSLLTGLYYLYIAWFMQEAEPERWTEDLPLERGELRRFGPSARTAFGQPRDQTLYLNKEPQHPAGGVFTESIRAEEQANAFLRNYQYKFEEEPRNRAQQMQQAPTYSSTPYSVNRPSMPYVIGNLQADKGINCDRELLDRSLPNKSAVFTDMAARNPFTYGEDRGRWFPTSTSYMDDGLSRRDSVISRGTGIGFGQNQSMSVPRSVGFYDNRNTPIGRNTISPFRAENRPMYDNRQGKKSAVMVKGSPLF